MFFSRVSRRFSRDIKLFRLLENWRDAFKAEATRGPLRVARLRNGVVIRGPETIDLAFLFHEIWVEEIYRSPGFEIRGGETVVDIGANIGVFATYAATRAPGVKVLSFEPFPDNVFWLQKNVEESGLRNVSVTQKAVAGVLGSQCLRVDPSNWILHALASNGHEGEGLRVECTSLDEIMDANNIRRCDLLKLDCEGSEYEILRKCSPGTLSRIRRIVGEIHEAKHIDDSVDSLCSFLQSRSFRIDRAHPITGGGGFISAINTAL